MIVDRDQGDRSPAVLDIASDLDPMTKPVKMIDDLLGSMGLDCNRIGGGPSASGHQAGIFDWLHDPARPCLRIGRLDAGPQAPDPNLEEKLWLVIASPGPEQTRDPIALRPERGRQGVKRALAGGELVGMSRAQIESRPPIVQEETGITSPQTGADAHEVGLDEGHRQPVSIDGSQIGSSTGRRRGGGEFTRSIGVDLTGTLGDTAFRDEGLGELRSKVRVRDQVVAIGRY